MRRLSLVMLVMALAPAAAAFAHESNTGALRIVHPWVFEQRDPAAGPVVVSMTIHNSGSSADRLLSAASPLAAGAELRLGSDPAPAGAAVAIPARGKVELGASGPHLRLIGLSRPLSGYDTVPLSLTFEKAGKVEIEVMVEERN